MKMEALDEALVRLQRAVTPEDFWNAAEFLLRSAMPVYHVLFGLKGKGTLPAFLRTSQPVPDEPEYFRRLDAAAPLSKVVDRSRGIRVSRMSDQVPAPLLLLSPFYRKFMKPEGWRYSAALFFWDRNDDFLGHLAVNRTKAQGDITDEEMQLLNRIHPHLAAAIERILASDLVAATGLGMEQAISQLPLPMLLLDWNLDLRYANPAGRAALAEWNQQKPPHRTKSESDIPSELLTACHTLRAAWESAFPAARVVTAEKSAAAFHAADPAFSAVVSLVEPEAGRALEPSFAIQFHLPPKHHASKGRALAELSRLTAAERSVVRLAAGGYDNAAIAAELCVSPNTVKTHLRHIFEKLGVTSRSQLVALQTAMEKA